MARTTIEVDGRELSVSNLDKVMYPATGFTKGDVIEYYRSVAPAMLSHLAGRCVTFRRFPNGVDGTSFFEKRCPSHRPEWVEVSLGPGDSGGAIDYCRLDDTPALVWAANLAALELHTPMARAVDIESPAMVVFDLDPGEGAGMTECAEVAMGIHGALQGLGLELVAKTSGSKGLQLYLPLNTPTSHDQAGEFALALAQMMEKHHRDLVVSNMKKELRKGKVLIDWSQNSRHKTTVCAYSLRARPTPTVSTPVTWDEVEAASSGGALSFTAPEVLARIEAHGDLFADAASLRQELPIPKG